MKNKEQTFKHQNMKRFEIKTKIEIKKDNVKIKILDFKIQGLRFSQKLCFVGSQNHTGASTQGIPAARGRENRKFGQIVA